LKVVVTFTIKSIRVRRTGGRPHLLRLRFTTKLPTALASPCRTQGFGFDFPPNSSLVSYSRSLQRHSQLLPACFRFFPSTRNGVGNCDPSVRSGSVRAAGVRPERGVQRGCHSVARRGPQSAPRVLADCALERLVVWIPRGAEGGRAVGVVAISGRRGGASGGHDCRRG
jgi:hypothetical protein